jgi:hypothetical protein
MAALIGIASNLRAVLAAHVPFQFMDRCGFWPADDVQCHSLMGIAAEAADLKVKVPRVEGVA